MGKWGYAVGLLALVAVACGSGGSDDFDSVADVVDRINEHTLSDGQEQIFVLIGASDGWAYQVTPGDYTVEIYVYRNLDALEQLGLGGALQSNTVIHSDGNLLLYLFDPPEGALERLVADIAE